MNINKLSSGDQPNSSGLCFRSQQDALDYAAQVVEYGNRLASYNLNLVERYIKGGIEPCMN